MANYNSAIVFVIKVVMLKPNSSRFVGATLNIGKFKSITSCLQCLLNMNM